MDNHNTDTKTDNLNTDTKTDNDEYKLLNTFLIKKRHDINLFLCSNIRYLQYNTQCELITNMYNDSGESLRSIFYGQCGPSHNSRMVFDILPNIELYKMIVDIMKSCNINKLEELESGIGLFTYIMQFINSYYRSNNDANLYILENITGNESRYYLETVQKLESVELRRKDIYEFILDDSFDSENTAYINIGSIATSLYNQIVLLTKMCHMKKPKLMMILSYKQNQLDNFIDGYTVHKYYPRVISKYESIVYNLNNSSNMILYAFVRNDITTPISTDVKQFTEFKTTPASLLHLLVENHKVPKCFESITDSVATEYIQKIHDYKITNIPLHLETLDEVFTYLYFYKMALDISNDYPPDILDKRENFLNLCKYIDMVYVNLNELHKLNVIPRNINNSQTVIRFLIKDYCYSNKLGSEIFRFFLDY